MAIINDMNLSLADWLQRNDPDGNPAKIVEVLKNTNPILEDAVTMEGNTPTGHKTTVRVGLPAVAWRMLNYGVPKSKSATVPVNDEAGILEAYSEIDVDLAMLNGNTAAFRFSEDVAFLAAMNDEMASTMFYGNPATDPKKFLGLSTRYGAISGATNARNVIDGGGVGSDNTSIWILTWGESTLHTFFPKGSKSGLQHKDLGEETVSDGAGGYYQALRSHFQWKIGLSLRDWRYSARIANIDVSDLAAAGNSGYTGPNLINLLIKASNAIQAMGAGKTVIYANRTVITALDLLATNNSNNFFRIGEWGGQEVTMFRRLPIRMTDAILNTESRVV